MPPKGQRIKMHKKSNKPFWGERRGNMRGGARTNYLELDERPYYGHDDRSSGHTSDAHKYGIHKPRVSFKKTSFKISKNNLLKKQLDDDVAMSTSVNRRPFIRGAGRGNYFPRGRYSPLPNSNAGGGRSRVFPPSESNWYSIIIPHGQKYTKDFVLESLKQYISPITFSPMMYKVIGNDAQFYVEDQKIATKLAECDKKIDAGDGYRLQIRVKPGQPPVVQITDALKERLKVAMGKRYIQETNALDLSKFYQDPDLASDYWCPLSIPNILMVVLDIVQAHIPNLEALNLDSNKLSHTEKLNELGKKFGNLKILHIGDNKIKELSFLNPLKTLQLKELRLEGNPMCHKYTNRHEEYVSEIRKMFPKLLKLDAVDLPPPIVFDLEDHSRKLLPTKPLYVAQSNEEAKTVASAFLERYFMVFDSGNRQPLLDAYHETACFSLTTTISSGSAKHSEYLSENRNLSRISDSNRRRKLLRRGKLSVVSFITDMPQTEHDASSFTMDISLVSKEMMLIVVTGLFKEMQSKNNKQIIRFFNRSLVIVPSGVGFCIVNEQLHLSYATMDQEKQFGNNLKIAQPVPGPSAESNPISNQTVPTEEVKQQMTMTLSQQTNMNIEWSFKCLQEVNWNFNNACSAFQEAFTLGKIPSSAFNKPA